MLTACHMVLTTTAPVDNFCAVVVTKIASVGNISKLADYTLLSMRFSPLNDVAAYLGHLLRPY